MRSIAIVLTLLFAACHLETEKHMGLLENPPTRPRTYGEGEPVDPNDMNEIFDRIIDNVARLDALGDARWRWFGPEKNIDFGGTVNYSAFGAEAAADGSGLDNQIKGLSPGDVIYELKIRLLGSAAAGTTHARIFEVVDGSTTLKADLAVVDPPAAWGTYSLVLGAPLTVLDEASYLFELEFGKTGRLLTSWGILVGS